MKADNEKQDERDEALYKHLTKAKEAKDSKDQSSACKFKIDLTPRRIGWKFNWKIYYR